MRPLAGLERFLERVFERPTARLFHPRVQPVMLQRRVERAMESGRLNAGERMLVPNRYVVALAPADMEALGDLAESLELELADAALRFAHVHRYVVADRPAVRLVADGTVAPGDPHVESSYVDGVAPAGQWAGDPRDAMPARGEPLDGTRTMIFQVPVPETPHAILREIAPDGSRNDLRFDGGPVTIGRATDNILVLRDSRVSRHHGRLTARQGALVYRDLGSTNGSRVNGVEIDEVVLGAGDRIELGDTVLVVESVAGG